MRLIQPALVKTVLVALGILSAVDAAIGALFILFFPVGFFADKTFIRVISDLAFVEGAGIFLVGALFAFLSSNITKRIVALMIVGVSMIGISVVLGAFS